MTRIIAGERKGLKLKNPKGSAIRPTTDRTKEWMFSVLFDVKNGRVLDLFCGAGNLGLEALSRGAANCTFVDQASSSINLTTRNVQKTRYEDRTTIIRADVLRFLKEPSGEFDLIFADPPYTFEQTALLFAGMFPWLSTTGRFVLESGGPIKESLPDQLVELRVKSLGTTTVTIYGKM